MKAILVSAVSLLSFAAPAALAQDAPNFEPEQIGQDKKAPPRSAMRSVIPAGLLYASFDTDGSYAVSQAELSAGIKRSFARADANGNTRVSLVELESWREVVLGSRDRLPGNTQFDKNFDSQIDSAEFKAVLTGLFRSFDANKNDALEFSEMTRSLRPARDNSVKKRERITTLDRNQRRRRGY